MNAKKIYSLLLCVVMALGCFAVTAYADDSAAAKIGGVEYLTLEAAVNAAADGDVITITKNISYDSKTAITLPDGINLTITSADGQTFILHNAAIKQGANTKLTVSNLEFTGECYILSGLGNSELAVVNVTGTTSATSTENNSRPSFISLINSEVATLKLTVTGCNIKRASYMFDASAICGWPKIADGSVIENNIFGSEDVRYCFAVLKFLNFANNANVSINNNTIYAEASVYAIQLAPNTQRANYYTVYGSGNKMYAEGNGDKYLFDIDIASGSKANGNLNLSADNYVDGTVVTANDISISNENSYADYVGIDVVLDNNNKIIGGTFARINKDAVADGYGISTDAEGTSTVIKEASSILFEQSESIIKEDSTEGGIRFVFNVNIAEGDGIDTFGAYIIPLSIFDNNSENDKTADSVNVQYNEQITDGESFSADIIGIPSSQFGTKVYAIPYFVIDNNVNTFTAAVAAVSE